jgi:hypothetical protein
VEVGRAGGRSRRALTAVTIKPQLLGMTVIPLPSHGRWAEDHRGEGRAVRVATHREAGLIVVSVWRTGACVGTVRLSPQAAADLVAGLTDGLAYLTAAGSSEIP